MRTSKVTAPIELAEDGSSRPPSPFLLHQLLTMPSRLLSRCSLIDLSCFDLDQILVAVARAKGEPLISPSSHPAYFGRIAATNAICDIYAMGANPILALAILGMPLSKLSPEIVREILRGGADVCAVAGIPVAGGHSIDTPEPIYGLAVIGACAHGMSGETPGRSRAIS